MDPKVRQLWIRYTSHRELEVRQQLLSEYTNLVKYVIGRFAMALPRSVDANDFMSSAVIGLIDAIDAFDPKLGVKFESYALPRIRGAVLDQLRAMDWAPRSIRRKARMVNNAVAQLEAILGYPPSDVEVADHLEIDLKTYHDMLQDINSISLVSLDDPLPSDEGEGSSIIDMIDDPDAVDPSSGIEDEEMKTLLAGAIEQLPERKRLVVALYYYEELTLKEIGQVLGVTESRVCQIHAEAVLFMKSKLNRMMQPNPVRPLPQGSLH